MKNNIEKTNALRILASKKIDFKTYSFPCDKALSASEVAEILQQDEKKIYKTLVTTSSSKTNYVFLVQASKNLDLKKAAKVVNEKYVEMLASKLLLPLTGYVHGGCSPIGMKKQFKTIIDSSCKTNESIIFSGGRIGLQVEIMTNDLKKVLEYQCEDISI